MIISIDAFDKIQYPIMIKTLKKLGIEGNYLNIIKAVHEKPTANFIVNDKSRKAYSPRSRTRQESECALSPPLFNSVLEV